MKTSAADDITKSALRAAALSRRNALSAEERARASLAIAGHAGPIIAGARPRAIAGYLPIRGECDPRPIMETAWDHGLDVALPAIIDSTTIVFRRYASGQQVVAGGFGTLQPAEDAPTLVPDLVIMPLVGFDRSGERLGYGRGHYDRAIGAIGASGKRPQLLGIAFAVQEVPPIPAEPHDMRLDWIVTETETLVFRETR